jgi:Fic family protein
MKPPLSTLLDTIKLKKEQLDTHRPLPPALVHNLAQWFTIELTYNSNALEGNTLTKSETAAVVEKGITVAGKPLKDHLEVTNYAIALNFVEHLVTQKRADITLNTLLDIHRIILKSIDDDHAGMLRKIAVRIAGSSLVLPDPVKVPDLMRDFIVWLQNTTDNPIVVSAEAHRRLVSIHPFVDGNGRTARLLMNLLLMQEGYPPAIIHVKNRSVYIDALSTADTTGNSDDFYMLVARAVQHSLDIYLEAAHKSI